MEYDSRLMIPNSLFFAIKGFSMDGYDYIEQAVSKGAVAVMGEREVCPGVTTHISVPDIRAAMAAVSAAFYGYPGLKIKACGVTGTNGKTTTAFMIKSILEAFGKKVGLITSLLYDTGTDQFDAERTTPESLDMQRLLCLMINNNCVNAVIEVSSHALVLKRAEHINFRVAVYTNLTRDHLDFHGSMEEYFEAKKLLKDKLEGDQSYAVINLDVDEFRELFYDNRNSNLSYSISNKAADVYTTAYDIQPDRTTFDLVTPVGKATITIKLPGRFNLSNAIAAAAGGLASGVDIEAVVAGLENANPIPGRFNYLDAGQPFAIYVDYAHTPDALERLIKSTREICTGRILTLFGCGGDRDRGKRPLMGEAVTSNSDYAILTSDNPRSESAMAIIEDVKPGMVGENYEIIENRKDAIKRIISLAQPGDAVLLAGKGAENYQDINGERSYFNDMEEAKEAINEIGMNNSGETGKS